MIPNSFLLQHQAFRKLLRPEIQSADALSEIKDWEHIELRNLWFAYIRDRWTYPSNLYFTEAITYFLHGYCHYDSIESSLSDHETIMVRLETLWAEFRHSSPFINDDGTLLLGYRESSRQALDDVLTLSRAVHEMCREPSVFDKHADNLGLIGKYDHLPLIWTSHPGNHFYGPRSFDGIANSDMREKEGDEESSGDDESNEEHDDDDNDNDNDHRPRSNRHGNKHHIASRRRYSDLFYDAPDTRQRLPPAASRQVEDSHNDRPFRDGMQQQQPQFEHAVVHVGGHLGASEESGNLHSQYQHPNEIRRHAIEHRVQTPHSDGRPTSHAPHLSQALHPVETRDGFPDNHNCPDHVHRDPRLRHKAQARYDQRRSSEHPNQVHTGSDTYQPCQQGGHLSSSQYQSDNPARREADHNVAHQTEHSVSDNRSANVVNFRPQGQTTRFDGPRPHNDLEQYHLGSSQRGNNHSSGTNHNNHVNSPGLFDRYGSRLQGSYGTGAPLPNMGYPQDQRDSGVLQTGPAIRPADNINNSSALVLYEPPPATTASVTSRVEPVPLEEHGRNPPATTATITFNSQTQRFRFNQPEHTRYITQTASGLPYYSPIVTARPQGFTTTIATTTHLVAQDLRGLGISTTGNPGSEPLEGGNSGQHGGDDRDCGNSNLVQAPTEGNGHDTDDTSEEDADREETEGDAEPDEDEGGTDNDENHDRGDTEGDSGDSIGDGSDKDNDSNGDSGDGNGSGSGNGNGNGNGSGNGNGGDAQDDNVVEANNGRTSLSNNNRRFGRTGRQAVDHAAPELSEKNVKDALVSIQPVMAEYGEYLIEKRKALEGPRENLEERRSTLREMKRVAQQVQDQFDERDALAKQAKAIDFQFRVCDDEMSKVLLDISMSNTYMSSALKRKRGH